MTRRTLDPHRSNPAHVMEDIRLPTQLPLTVVGGLTRPVR